jgi:hypothetical protein
MRIEQKMKVLCLSTSGRGNVKLMNSNKELINIVNDLFNCTNGFIDLNYLFELDFNKKSFEGYVGTKKVNVNLFTCLKNGVSIIEQLDDYSFSLTELKNSQLFLKNFDLLNVSVIHENLVVEIGLSFKKLDRNERLIN